MGPRKLVFVHTLIGLVTNEYIIMRRNFKNIKTEKPNSCSWNQQHESEFSSLFHNMRAKETTVNYNINKIINITTTNQ